MLGAILQKSLATASWRPVFVHFWPTVQQTFISRCKMHVGPLLEIPFSVVLAGPCIMRLEIYVWCMECGWVYGVRVSVINEHQVYYGESKITKLKNMYRPTLCPLTSVKTWTSGCICTTS
jgi:hypothetical protein